MAYIARLHTRPTIFSRLVLYCVCAAALGIVLWLFVPRKDLPYPRQTMILVGSPMTVLSWNERDRALTIITLPENMSAEGTHGYGTYSLEAFWSLGEIDKKDGTVLSESLSEALGVPVSLYIGPKSGIFPSAPDGLTRAKQVFSVGSLLSYVSQLYRTNIPLTTFMRYVWLLQVTKPERVSSFDFTRNVALIADDVLRADGSHEAVLNVVRVDARLAHVFEDERVRRESVTTGVYNTTEMPSLGNRVARLLGNLGVSVVSVGNDAPEVETCTVSGTKAALRSVSASVVESVLGCVARETKESERTDLTIRIGSAYAKRFLPN